MFGEIIVRILSTKAHELPPKNCGTTTTPPLEQTSHSLLLFCTEKFTLPFLRMGNKHSGHSEEVSDPLTPIVRVERWEVPEKRYDSGVIDFIIAQVPPPLTTPCALKRVFATFISRNFWLIPAEMDQKI